MNYKSVQQSQCLDRISEFSCKCCHGEGGLYINNKILDESKENLPNLLNLPEIFPVLNRKCELMIQCIQNKDYDGAKEAINHLSLFFRNNYQIFRNSTVDTQGLSNIIGIIISTNILPTLIEEMVNPILFDNIVYFIAEISTSNDKFCSLISEFNFIDPIVRIILSNPNIENSTKVNSFIAVSSMIKKVIMHEGIDWDSFISMVLVYFQYLFNSSICDIDNFVPSLLAIISKAQNISQFYPNFLNFLESCSEIKNQSFDHIVRSLHTMLKREPLCVMLPVFEKLISKLNLSYIANIDFISSFYFCNYLKLLTKTLKCINLEKITENNDIVKKLFSSFSFDLLFSKLNGDDNESIHSVLSLIGAVIRKNCVMAVFHDQRKLVRNVLLIYEGIPLKEKVKVLKLISEMLKYSKFFRREILSLEFTDSFIQMIESEMSELQSAVVQFLAITLQIYQKNQKMTPCLKDLVLCEEFMAALFEASQSESGNPELQLIIQSIGSQLHSCALSLVSVEM